MFKNSLDLITLDEPRITDFAAVRNRLLRKSDAKWVFFLDSDESMTGKLRKEVGDIISTAEVKRSNFNGFYVKRKNYFLGKFIGTDKIIRLGKKDAGRWRRKVHEVWRISGKIGELKNPIIHETAKSLKEYISKLNHYSTLHAEANISDGKRADFFKVVFYPKLKFFESIIGGRGLVFSILQSFHSFLAWSKLWILQES